MILHRAKHPQAQTGRQFWRRTGRRSVSANLLRIAFGVLLSGAALGAVWALTLDPNIGVTPKIFSPNGDNLNDIVYFNINNPTLGLVEGRILDLSGGEVAQLRVVFPPLPPLNSEALQWDGRDSQGHVVPAGPYIYQIQGSGAMLSGIVVVAL